MEGFVKTRIQIIFKDAQTSKQIQEPFSVSQETPKEVLKRVGAIVFHVLDGRWSFSTLVRPPVSVCRETLDCFYEVNEVCFF